MTRTAISFLLGVTVAAIAIVGSVLIATIALDAAGATALDIHLGELSFYAFERSADGIASHVGPGMLLVLGLGGVLNAVGARSLGSRRPALR